MPRAKRNRAESAVVTTPRRTKAYQHTEEREHAAQLLAEDRLPDWKIAEKIGIGRTTLAEWKRLPKFAQRVDDLVSNYAARALNAGLARKERRLRVLNEMHDKILQVIDERGEDVSMATIPGGKTGIVVRNLKSIGKGDDFQVVESYEIDIGAIRTIASLQEQVVKELGGKFGMGVGAGEVIPATTATQVNVNVGTQVQIEEQHSKAPALHKENPNDLYDRLREVYGLSKEYISRRVSVTVQTEEFRATDRGTTTGADTESVGALPLSS